MTDSWELLCYHTYTGIPGVVVDRAPRGVGHGRAVGIADGDFLADGASAGSGSVRFSAVNGCVKVPALDPVWHNLAGVKAEVTMRWQPLSSNFVMSPMISCNSFQFFLRDGSVGAWFNSGPVLYAEVGSLFDPVGPGPAFAIPTNKWMTLGFLNDGFGRLEISADGEVVGRKTGAYEPLNAIDGNGLFIGNWPSSGWPLGGDIDTVKIWRLNPRKIYDDFHARPISYKTAECWKAFEEGLLGAMRANPDCASQIMQQWRNVLRGYLRTIQAQGAACTAQLHEAAQAYDKLWRSGNIGTEEMAKAIAKLVHWLRISGIAPENDAAFNALVDSRCFRLITAQLKPPDCDRAYVRMIESTARLID